MSSATALPRVRGEVFKAKLSSGELSMLHCFAVAVRIHCRTGRASVRLLENHDESTSAGGTRNDHVFGHDAADVEVIRSATRMLASWDYQYGGGRSRLLVGQCLATEALPLARQVSPSTTIGREYLTAVAALARLAGWTAYDIGSHGSAQRLLTVAPATGARPEKARVRARPSPTASHRRTGCGGPDRGSRPTPTRSPPSSTAPTRPARRCSLSSTTASSPRSGPAAPRHCLPRPVPATS